VTSPSSRSIPESECGDSDRVTVTALPNTAIDATTDTSDAVGMHLIGTALLLTVRKLEARRA
jgi:hypothetical protein